MNIPTMRTTEAVADRLRIAATTTLQTDAVFRQSRVSNRSRLWCVIGSAAIRLRSASCQRSVCRSRNVFVTTLI